jgi:threonine dehydrogenase-like Zn-dependent dehydrogenase
VGLVKSCLGGQFPVGARVAALMGGLGRTINGRYAEYTRAPVSNVALIQADLPWAELATIPETYATAWTCLFRNLAIQKGRLLVIRGATSSFGQAALKMAVNAGARVIATPRSRERFPCRQNWCRALRDRAPRRAGGDRTADGVPGIAGCALDDRLDAPHGRRGGTVDLAKFTGGECPRASSARTKP